jgi:hypothetical protein
MAAELNLILGEIGLGQYFSDCFCAGFRSWEVLCTITESQLAVIKFRLGHRRKLQREIARRQLQWPDYKPLPTESELQRRVRVSFKKALRVDPGLREEKW